MEQSNKHEIIENTIKTVLSIITLYVSAFTFYSYISISSFLKANGLNIPYVVITPQDLWFADYEGNFIVIIISSIGLILSLITKLMGLDFGINLKEIKISNILNKLKYKKFESIMVIIVFVISPICLFFYFIIPFTEIKCHGKVFFIISCSPLILYPLFTNKDKLLLIYWVVSLILGYFIIKDLQLNNKLEFNNNLTLVYNNEKRGRETKEYLIFWGREKVVLKDTTGNIRLCNTSDIVDVKFWNK